MALLIIVIAVWRRVQSDKKRLAMMPKKKRRSLDDPDSPIYEKPGPYSHRRFPSTSSFGDGAPASALLESSPHLEPPKGLPPIADEDPPPTPFAAPPLIFPPTARRPSASERTSAPFPDPADFQVPQRRASTGLARLSRPASGVGGTNTYRPFIPTGPPDGFVLAAAPPGHMNRPVPKYTSFNPDTPPTRPASFATTETDTAIWGNHPT